MSGILRLRMELRECEVRAKGPIADTHAGDAWKINFLGRPSQNLTRQADRCQTLKKVPLAPFCRLEMLFAVKIGGFKC